MTENIKIIILTSQQKKLYEALKELLSSLHASNDNLGRVQIAKEQAKRLIEEMKPKPDFLL